MTQVWEKALRDALFLMDIGLESKSALKQAGASNGIAYGDEMGAFVRWATRKI